MNIRTLMRLTRTAVGKLCFVTLLAWTLTPCAAADEKTSDDKSNEAAIRAAADAFVKAFDRGDAKAVAALWLDNGSLIDDQGRSYKGRSAIEDAYTAFFTQNPGVRIKVAVQSVEFPVPTMAVEDGIASVVTDQGDSTTASRYTAFHVLQDGKWLMVSVRESNIEIPSNYGRLKQLESLVGDWETKSDGTTVHTSIRWIANRSFLQREYSVQQDGLATSSGVQIIGWDPQANRIRSWSFDSSGGSGTGVWTPTPEGWRIESNGVLANGAPASSQEFLILAPGEADVLGWRSTDRKVGAVELPDTREVVLERLPEKH
jgi:uncharacterized protein (TIGR02246 family)